MYNTSRNTKEMDCVYIGNSSVVVLVPVRTCKFSGIRHQDALLGQYDRVEWLEKGVQSRQLVMQEQYQAALRRGYASLE